jgi:hypothetical protein
VGVGEDRSRVKNNWLGTKEAAERLNIRRHDVYEGIKYGDLRAFQAQPAGKYYIDPEDLEDWYWRSYRYESDRLYSKEKHNRRLSQMAARCLSIRLWEEQVWEDALSELPERLRYVMIMRRGLFGEDPHLLSELSDEMQISRERVRQLEREAERRLKKIVLGGGAE